VTAPRRLLEDPEADCALRDALRGAPPARPLDTLTRRRLGAKVARASALPVAAAGWLFVKSATAALGVVLGTGAVAVASGIIEWEPQTEAVPTVSPPPAPPRASVRRAPLALPDPGAARTEEEAAPATALNPTPTLPADSSGGTRLSDEAALLEAARAKLRSSPEAALATTRQHAARFPRGQLGSERSLIQIEALHRLGRDAEARALSRELLEGPGASLYAERVRQLLGERAP
jgi:hypothetical protein